MKRYIIRSVKYFIAICVIYLAIIYLMRISGNMQLTLAQSWAIQISTWKGYAMIIATIILSATYPLFGFVTRTVEGDINEHRTQIINAFDIYGFSLRSEKDGVMVFRADGLRRVTMLFEDEILVRQEGDQIQLSGIRRAVVKIAIRLDGYIISYNRVKE